VIDAASNTVTGSPIPVGSGPNGVAVGPPGSKVYVANFDPRSVSVIATGTNMVTGSPIPVVAGLVSFGEKGVVDQLGPWVILRITR
jgi:YVTN family beta-propeller protein